jgi:hypothetical protein
MQILKNSYVIFFITFIVLSLLSYFFKIGGTNRINTSGKIPKVDFKYSWKYPLGISLLVWLLVHFWVYPPDDILYGTIDMKGGNTKHRSISNKSISINFDEIPKMDLNPWN